MRAVKSGRCTGLLSAWLFSHPSYRFMTVIHTVLYDSHVNIYVTRDVSFRYSSSNIFYLRPVETDVKEFTKTFRKQISVYRARLMIRGKRTPEVDSDVLCFSKPHK